MLAPVSKQLQIPVHKRGKFLGQGGLNVKKITGETGVQIIAKDDKRLNWQDCGVNGEGSYAGSASWNWAHDDHLDSQKMLSFTRKTWENEISEEEKASGNTKFNKELLLVNVWITVYSFTILIAKV